MILMVRALFSKVQRHWKCGRVRRLIAVYLCASEESSESEAEESPPSKWMMMTPKYMEKLKASKRRTLGTKSHFQMNLRSRQPPNYQKSN